MIYMYIDIYWHETSYHNIKSVDIFKKNISRNLKRFSTVPKWREHRHIHGWQSETRLDGLSWIIFEPSQEWNEWNQLKPLFS